MTVSDQTGKHLTCPTNDWSTPNKVQIDICPGYAQKETTLLSKDQGEDKFKSTYIYKFENLYEMRKSNQQ